MEFAEVRDPIVADGLGNCARQRWVCQPQPATGRDTVGLVVEAFREDLGQILHRRRPQQVAVNCGNAIGAVRADDCQVRHAHMLFRSFLNQAHIRHTLAAAGETDPDVIEQPPIDLEDNLEVTG